MTKLTSWGLGFINGIVFVALAWYCTGHYHSEQMSFPEAKSKEHHSVYNVYLGYDENVAIRKIYKDLSGVTITCHDFEQAVDIELAIRDVISNVAVTAGKAPKK